MTQLVQTLEMGEAIIGEVPAYTDVQCLQLGQTLEMG